MTNVPNSQIADILSVDVEDYFHVEAFAGCVSRDDWERYPSRVRRNTLEVLSLFAEHGARGTFFVLGWVAERDPQLVREIAAAGHELACHSFAHRQVFALTPEEFRADLRRAKAAIEDAAGAKIFGYRAPTFSIVRRSLWALDILAEEGFLYDSSVFPIHHDLYGFPDAPRRAYKHSCAAGGAILEIPMSTVRIAGKNLPVGGGGYLRLLPMSYTRWAMRAVHEREQQPVVVYLHPWEIDPEQPRIAAGWKSRLRHYTGLGEMKGRLKELLAGGRFAPAMDLAKKMENAADLPSLPAHQ
jgi:polysaccharide deacetylase family protein (PEP-CTERM system associated)